MSNKTSQTDIFPRMLMTQLQVGFNVFCFIFGGLGNSLVLTVILNKKQRNNHDIFVANLAIADILYILFSFPGDMFQVLKAPPNSRFYCAAVRPLYTIFFCLGLFTITLMALYRCYVMVNPYKPKMKKVFVYRCVLALWIMAFLTSLPSIIVSRVSRSGYCTGKWKSPSYKDAYVIFLFLIRCIIPLSLIAVSYFRLGTFLIYDKPIAVTNAASSQRDRIEDMRIIRTTVFIVLLFTLCTLPYQVGWAIMQFGDAFMKRKASLILRVTRLIQILHACVNPIIYAISWQYFRQEYKRYLRKVCCLKDKRIIPSSNDGVTQHPPTQPVLQTHTLSPQVHNNNEDTTKCSSI